jgi:predicted nucleic acid-binding protein
MSNPIRLDNTVLTNLALVGQVDLVFQLWSGRICTTEDVLREYQVAVQKGLLPGYAWSDLHVVTIKQSEEAMVKNLSLRLGRGESSCIAVAHGRKGLFVSDDADARRVAMRMGLRVSGTLGILVLVVRKAILTLEQANGLLSDLITAVSVLPWISSIVWCEFAMQVLINDLHLREL